MEIDVMINLCQAKRHLRERGKKPCVFPLLLMKKKKVAMSRLSAQARVYVLYPSWRSICHLMNTTRVATLNKIAATVHYVQNV